MSLINIDSLENSPFLLCCINCFESNGIKEYFKRLQKGEEPEVTLSTGNCEYCSTQNTMLAPMGVLFLFIFKRLLSCYSIYRQFKKLLSLTTIEEQEIEENRKITIEEAANRHSIFSSRVSPTNVQTFLRLGLILTNSIGMEETLAPDFENEILYKFNEGTRYSHLSQIWQDFKNNVVEIGRFFDIKPRFNRSKQLKTLKLIFENHCNVIELSREMVIYRARNITHLIDTIGSTNNFEQISNFIKDKNVFELLSSPKPEQSTANRMNPNGIPYLYCANSIETCVHELQPQSSDIILVGGLRPKKTLKILDLASIPDIQEDDIFHELYAADAFMKAFIDELAEPVNPNTKEFHYIPTQVVSEYIKSLKVYDGFMYKSSQYKGGINYTLFCSPSSSYVPGFDYDKDKGDTYNSVFELANKHFLKIKPTYTKMESIEMFNLLLLKSKSGLGLLSLSRQLNDKNE